MSEILNKKIVGIVCEYNPFHLGHAWMVETLRQNGADCIVCVMSGPFVQRAEGAIFPTSLRARAAVLGGADLVFRLPFSWATASAEQFAYGAVGLIQALGCVEELAFGAETADTETLYRLASCLQGEPFQVSLKEALSEGNSFAHARAKAAEIHFPGAQALLNRPNNILGVEYCKALHRGFPQLQFSGDVAHLRPLALPRKGAQHDGDPLSGIASASWLRQKAQESDAQVLAPYVPNECQMVYEKAWREGAYLNRSRFELMLLSRLKGSTPQQMKNCIGAGEGLEMRVAKAAVGATSLQQLYDSAKSKRFAHSRVRRLALSAAVGQEKQCDELPPFLHLLAASKQGLSVLRMCKESTALPLSTSLAKLAKCGEQAESVVRQEALAEDLHALCLHHPGSGGKVFTDPFQIVER